MVQTSGNMCDEGDALGYIMQSKVITVILTFMDNIYLLCYVKTKFPYF